MGDAQKRSSLIKVLAELIGHCGLDLILHISSKPTSDPWSLAARDTSVLRIAPPIILLPDHPRVLVAVRIQCGSDHGKSMLRILQSGPAFRTGPAALEVGNLLARGRSKSGLICLRIVPSRVNSQGT